MANYILLHGGGMGGWVWKYVASPLRAAGHTVYTPTFTGFGERHHLMSYQVDNAVHVADVLGMMDCEEINDAVLVAHSYAGSVAPGIIAAARGRISRVVYVDAIVPRSGECVIEALGYMTAEQAADMRALHARGEGPLGMGVPEQVRAMADVEPQKMSPDRDAWVFRHLTDMPLSANVSLIPVGAESIDIPADYIAAKHTMMGPMHERAAALGWRMHYPDAECCHMLHVGFPELVLGVLETDAP